jgi:hypothetical protein
MKSSWHCSSGSTRIATDSSASPTSSATSGQTSRCSSNDSSVRRPISTYILARFTPWPYGSGGGRSRTRGSSHRRIEEKLAAEGWLLDHGEISDVPFMAKRLKRLITAKRVRTYLPPEVSLLVPFLLRFRDVPEAADALEAVRADHTRLGEAERRWLEANRAYLLSEDVV